MTAGSLCSRVVVTASPLESVRAAARRMAEHDVGTLIVAEPAGNQAIGILTDRDIVIRCVAGGADPDTMPVARVMSMPVRTVDENAAVEDAISTMAAAGTRRLVVTATGKARAMVGVLSLDDVLDLLSLDAHGIGRLVEKQNPRVPM